MTNKEFVEYCRVGDIAKVAVGVEDKTLKHDIWGSKALLNAFNSIAVEKRDIDRMSKVIDLLIQNTNVDPSIDPFILVWAMKKCESKTIDLIINHKNVKNNLLIWARSGQIADNAFSRQDKDDVLPILLTNPTFDIELAFRTAIWGTDLPFIIWSVQNNNSYKNCNSEHIEKGLYKLVSLDLDDIKHKAFIKLYKESNFPRSYNGNYYPLIAHHMKDMDLLNWFKEDPKVIDMAIKKDQYELIDKDAVDIFIF